jgi:hypothetical protein
MNKTEHLTQDDLILFMDGEIAAKEEQAAVQKHLLGCSDCAQRLGRLKSGSGAYEQYREQVLDPALQVPTSGWARLSHRSELKERRRWGFVWAAACACGLALAIVHWRAPGQPNAQELLTRAEEATEPARATLLLTTGKSRLIRPALLEPGNSEVRFQHVQVLFVRANYSWEDPLSARSFAAWRRTLSQREDLVTSVRDPGGRKLYRLQTRTAVGVLRSASLTLQAVTYHATQADFEFQGEEPIELSEQTETPMNGLQEVRQFPVTPQPEPRIKETMATPEDELRVFAALDAIGADTEEPIDIKLDAGQHSIIVSGMGMPEARRKEIETALAVLPHAVVRFSARQPPDSDSGLVNNPGSTADGGHLAFRRKLEDRYGGARQLQVAADQALDTSNSLFARTHALRLLAREFPSAVEGALGPTGSTSLLSLRQRHVGAMEFAMRQLREELLPLTAGVPQPDRSTAVSSSTWQTGAQQLFDDTRNLDGLVSRLLAGSYTEQEGNEMLQQLPAELARVETAIRAQSVTDHR